MADYSSTNRVGRFGMRTPAPITTFVKVDDRRSDQGPAVGRAEISEEHVAMPVSLTDGVVTNIETIERVYTTSATAYTDGFTTNGEIIENYATTEGLLGSNRSAFPRGLFPRQTLNNSKADSGTNEAVTNAWNKSIGDGAKDGANEWSRQEIEGVANSTRDSQMRTGVVLSAIKPSRQIGDGAKDIGTNGWSGSTEEGINESGTGDAGPTGSSKPIGGGNKDVGPNQLSRPGGGNERPAGVVLSERYNPTGVVLSAIKPSRQIGDGAKDIGPNGRRGLTGGTNYIRDNPTSRPSVKIADEYRLNRPDWGQPPTNDIPTRRPTKYPGVAVETVKEPSKAPQQQVALPWRGQFSPSSVTPATEPKTIDSNAAAAKYNGIGFTARGPQSKKVIDSREAAEKYKGLFI